MRGPHWLRRNDTSWSPSRVIVLDAEARTTDVDGGELDTFALAVASFTIRSRDRDAKPRTEEESFDDVPSLWQQVNRWTHHGHATWLVTHNLAYDYIVTAAHRELPALGWELVDWSTRTGARWVRWRRHGRSLVMVDLFNYLPKPLAEIGDLVGLAKRGAGRPPDGVKRSELLRRCERDVAIARKAFLALLDWWDASDLGRWGFTSASCAMAAFRHRFLAEGHIYVHDTPEVRELERRALFGGRREIYRQGRLEDGPWADLDYVSHYCMTAGLIQVPVRGGYWSDEVRPDVLEHLPDNAGIIADVTVEVNEPVAPYRHERLGVLYPVGTFRTTLCQPELELVARHGRITEWHRVALYTMAPALQAWADWVLTKIDRRKEFTRAQEVAIQQRMGASVVQPRRRGSGGSGPLRPDGAVAPVVARAEQNPLVLLLLKDWTRSLIGKFGQRKPVRLPEPEPGQVQRLPDITVSEHDVTVGLPWTSGPGPDPLRGEDCENAVPAITAWVHSAARVALWDGMTAAGREQIAYVDTDGFLVRVDEHNMDRLATIAPELDRTATTVQGMLPDPPRQRRRPTTKERRTPRRPKTVTVHPTPPPPGTLELKGKYSGVTVHRPQDYELDRTEVIKGLPRARRKIADRTWEAEFWPGIVWQLARGRPGTFVRPHRTVHLTEEYLRGWVTDDGRVLPLEARVGAHGFELVPWHRTRHAKAGARLKDPLQGRRIAAVARSPGP